MTDDNYTDITVVLDRSGSMSMIKDDTEGGFNAFMAEQRKLSEGGDPSYARVSLVQFDDEIEAVWSEIPVEKVALLSLQPRGMTALLDAIGLAITKTGERLAAKREEDRPSRVIVVIITDGHENASREWTRDKVFEAIGHQRDTYGWQFVFLAAGQDAVATGESLNIDRGQTMTYAATGQGVSTAFATTSRNIATYRGAAPSAGIGAYTDEDRAEADTK